MADDQKKPTTRNAARHLGQRTLDCSTSKSATPGPRSIGTTNAARQLGTATLSAATPAQKSPVWLVVKLRYPTGMSAEVVAEHAHRIVAALSALEPELGLRYDEQRSVTDAERRNVSVAVAPAASPPDLEQRLNRLLNHGRGVVSMVPVVGFAVEWDNPLAA